MYIVLNQQKHANRHLFFRLPTVRWLRDVMQKIRDFGYIKIGFFVAFMRLNFICSLINNMC